MTTLITQYIGGRLFWIATLAVFAGCDLSYQDHKKFVSPDGRYVVETISELQAANDPEPWWQLISIHHADRPTDVKKANLFRYSSSTPPTILWKDSLHLEILMRDVGDTFEGPKNNSALREITLNASLQRPGKNGKK